MPRTSLYGWQTSGTMRRGAAPPRNVWRSEVKASAPRDFELHSDDPRPPSFWLLGFASYGWSSQLAVLVLPRGVVPRWVRVSTCWTLVASASVPNASAISFAYSPPRSLTLASAKLLCVRSNFAITLLISPLNGGWSP